jgi:predicted ferric reductase
LFRLVPAGLAVGITLGLVLAALPDAGTAWRRLAVISGWAGGGLLAVAMLLMVRLPRLSRAFGELDNAYLWHHRCGTGAYLALLLHPLALAMDSAQSSPGAGWSAIAPTSGGWALWLGWASLLGLMLGLMTTFALELPYRIWRNAHWLLAFGVVGGVAHTLAYKASHPAGLALAGLCMLALGGRFVSTVLATSARRYRVVETEPAAERIVELKLEPENAHVSLHPGQFVMVAFDTNRAYRGCGEFHPFTASEVGEDGSLALAIKALGPCTRHIQTIKPGAIARVQGPFGGFLSRDRNRPQLWVAAGIGITPFVAALRAKPCPVATELIYAFAERGSTAFIDELGARAESDPLLSLTRIEAADARAAIQSRLDEIGDLSERALQICGPADMVAWIAREARQRGVAAGRIHYERFDFR